MPFNLNFESARHLPLNRGVARELGVGIGTVPINAEYKRHTLVTTEQVAVRRRRGSETGEVDTAEPAVEPATDAEEDVERIPYRGLQRTVGERMSNAKFTAPHVTAHHHPDVTELVRVRAELAQEAEERGVRLTCIY